MPKRGKKGYGFISSEKGQYICHCYVGRLPSGAPKYHVLRDRYSTIEEAKTALLRAHDDRIADESGNPLFDVWLTEYLEKIEWRARLPSDQVSYITRSYFRSVQSTIDTALRPMKNSDVTYHGYVPLAQMRVNCITTEIVQELIDYLAFQKELSVSRIKNVVACIDNAYKLHPEYVNPINASLRKEGKQPKRNRVCQDRLMDILTQLLIYTRTDKKESAAVLCAIATGLRLAELCGLQWQDIQETKNSVLISVSRQLILKKLPGQIEPYTLTPLKTEKANRVVPCSASSPWYVKMQDLILGITAEDLDKEPEEPSPEDFIFGTKNADGKSIPMRPDHLSTYFRKFQISSGFFEKTKPYSFHDLRNYYIKTLFQRGMQPAEIARLVGHASLQTTYRYYQAPLDVDGAVLLSEKIYQGTLNGPDGAEKERVLAAIDRTHPFTGAENQVYEELRDYYIEFVRTKESVRPGNRLTNKMAISTFENWAEETFDKYLWEEFWQEDCRAQLKYTSIADLLKQFKTGMANFDYCQLDPYCVYPEYMEGYDFLQKG